MDTFPNDIGQDSVSRSLSENPPTNANTAIQSNFALEFAVDGPDVLENFDFDSFLNTDDNNGFGNFDLMTFGNDGIEAGAE
jgi:hypothetical protein